MHANDILSFFGRLKLPGGIEGKLRRDRLDKRLGLFITVGGFLIQLITQAATKENYLQDLPKYLAGFFRFIGSVIARDWQTALQFRMVPGLTGIIILAVGLLLYLLIVLRSFLKQYSTEAFQYTFWIDQFSRAEGRPEKNSAADPDSDPLQHLMHHDLMERLSQRIGRLSLIDDSKLDANEKLLLSSHIHIDGYYTVRLGKQKSRIIHVMPRIRIGPSDMPWILTRPIQFAMKKPQAGPAVQVPVSESSPKVEKAVTSGAASEAEIYRIPIEDYSYVVERVYSNIATEIYKQIKADLITKMRLFPTKYLRAVALYYEAEDFARSNTVDAYDHAVDLYRQSRECFDKAWRVRLTQPLLRIPYLSVGTSSQIMRAKTEIGYAKCVIYRRRISALSGRYKDPLFEVSEIMNKVVRSLIAVHNNLHRKPWRLEIPWPFALSSSGLLQVEDLNDKEKLIALLRSKEPGEDSDDREPIRDRIRRRLSTQSQRIIDSGQNLPPKDNSLRTLIRDLNLALQTEHLHHLPTETDPTNGNNDQVKFDRTLVSMNRMLLDYAFDGAIRSYRLQQQKGQAQIRERSTLVFLAPKGKASRFRFLRDRLVEEVQGLLFEAYLVASLAFVDLSALQRATECRELAKAISPEISEHDPLYLLTAGSIEPNLMKAVSLLGQAAEIDSDFQIAKYLLAERLAFQFRMVSEFTQTRLDPVIKKYDDVLRLNPGNIAALAAQGYLSWLVRDPESATNRFEEGSEIKAVVSETFIGELDYGLARVAAEEGDFETSFYLYTQAMSADPGLASALVTASKFATTYYYDYIGPAMLARYEEFVGRVEYFMVQFGPGDFIDVPGLIAELKDRKSPVAKYILDKWPESIERFPENATHRKGSTSTVSILTQAFNKLLTDSELYEPSRLAHYTLSEQAYDLIYKRPSTARLGLRNRLILEAVFHDKILRCFNESGSGNLKRSILNASQQAVSKKAVDGVYSYVLNDYGNACLNYYLRYGDPVMLEEAINALEQSTRLYPNNAVAYFNLSTAYSHKDFSLDKIIECLDTAEKLVPAWPFVRTTSALQKVRKTREEIELSDYWINYFQDRVDEREAKAKELKAIQSSLKSNPDKQQQTGTATQEAAGNPIKVEDLFTNERQLRATTADRSQKLDEEILAASREADEYRTTLQSNQEELATKQHVSLERFNDALANIFADTKLQPLFQETKVEAVVQTLHRLLVDNAIDWTRMNETDVNALKACAELLSYSDNRDLKSLDASRRLAIHILDRYDPEGFETNEILYNLYFKLGNASGEHAKITMGPVTDGWLASGIQEFLTIYHRFIFNLEQSSDHADQSKRDHSLFGHIFARLRRFDEAIKEYRLAIEEDPSCAAHHLRLAEIYSDQWERDKELEELVEAQLLDPDNPQVRNGLGRRFNQNGNIHYGRQDWKQASKEYESATRAAPYDHIYHSNLGLALEKLIVNDNSGNVLDQAMLTCQRASVLAPDNTEYSERLDRLATRKKWNALPKNDCLGSRSQQVSPICLELSPQLIALFELTNSSQLSPRLQSYLTRMREYHWQVYGAIVPSVRVCKNNDLSDRHYAVSFYENPVRWWENQVCFSSKEVEPDRRLFVGNSYLLEEAGVVGEETIDPLLGGAAYWVQQEDWNKLARDGPNLLGVDEFPIRHLTYLVGMSLSELLGHQEVLELVKIRMPGLHAKLSESHNELRAFTTVLKALLRERVSIEPLAAIYNKFDRLCSAGVSLLTVVERVRQIPQVRSNLPGAWDTFQYYRLSAAAESFIEGALDNSGSQPVMAMEPEPCQTALSKVREFVDLKQQRGFAIVTRKSNLRPHLRRLVELEFPHLWILSEDEMTGEMKKRIVADGELDLTVNLPGAANDLEV